MSTELNRVIDSVCRDKGIDKEAIVSAVEEAVLSAAHKLFRMDESNKELEVYFNEEDGEIDLFEFKTVVNEVEDEKTQIQIDDAMELDPEVEEGDLIGVKISPEYTRIAIQNAKQKILQKLKEAEGKVIYEEFKNRKNELVSGIVRRIERRRVIVDLGKTEAILPPEFQVPQEYYRIKERIRALLVDIKETKKVPQLIISRTHPEFVSRLFAAEVPEISEGIVEIKRIARDPGTRTKIAVASLDSDVDPVGSCVGMKGSRVQNIIQELRGEKIDIVPWSPEPARFVCNALSPAQVNKVIIDEEDKAMEVIVDDDQLSLAIGRRGQNVRLASKLTEWRVDIKTDTQIKEEQNEVIVLRMTLPNVGEVTANLLYSEGFRTLQDVAFADVESVMKASGLSEELVESVQAATRLVLKNRLEQMSASAVEPAPEESQGEIEAESPGESEVKSQGEPQAESEVDKDEPDESLEAGETEPDSEEEMAVEDSSKDSQSEEQI